jgi:RimJ/RimL family protein N-acetyltransferase
MKLFERYSPLFESVNLRLTPLDVEKDSQVIAEWTYELETARKLRDDQPARPMPVFEVKRVAEQWQKESDERNSFLFAIRLQNNDDVIGVIRINFISWVNGAAYFDLIIGEAEIKTKFGQEALELAMRFGFEEAGLFRMTAVIAEYDETTSQLYKDAGFTLEVRQRQSLYWKARHWDKLHFGMLRPEWKMLKPAVLQPEAA